MSNAVLTTSQTIKLLLELSTNDLRRILASQSLIVKAVTSIKGGEYLQLEIT